MSSARKQRRQAKQRTGPKRSKRQDVSADELHAIIERAKSVLSASDQEKLTGAVDTLAYLTQELDTKGASIRRLRKIIFGSSSEKTRDVVGQGSEDAPSDEPTAPVSASRKDSKDKPEGNPDTGNGKSDQVKPPPKGHGRAPSSDYTGAEILPVPHERLKLKDICPECDRGKVYRLKEPKRLLRIRGVSPLIAKLYECERLRCNLCGKVFTAKSPAGVGDAKYDESAAALIALLKYGVGLPFNRIARLQKEFGVPLPTSTQWDVIEAAAALLAPTYSELVSQAAQGEVLYNDDTTMKVLELDGPEWAKDFPTDDAFEGRTGVWTSGVVSTGDRGKVALFFTGQKHAGENLSDVLSQRSAELGLPIQMCDALSRNTCGEFETLLANCNTHARRNFVEVEPNFPEEVRHVLNVWRQVYVTDANARQEKLDPAARLAKHQAESEPIMTELKRWGQNLLDQKQVEENSGLGVAIRYMLKHWSKLTLFLREPGAPLDNNLCERVLKKAILHRKNALFYRTLNGARVGDMFMSLIHTAELNKVEAFPYLVAVLRHHDAVAEAPADWMPWNYAAALAKLPAPLAAD